MIAESSIQDRHAHPARVLRRQRVAAWRHALKARRGEMLLRLRADHADPEDDEEVFLGVFAPVMPRKVLAEFQVEVDISKLPRLQPHVFIEPSLLSDDE